LEREVLNSIIAIINTEAGTNFQKSSNYAAADDNDYGRVVILYTSPSVIRVIKSRRT
jgi:hypothetical protein